MRAGAKILFRVRKRRTTVAGGIRVASVLGTRRGKRWLARLVLAVLAVYLFLGPGRFGCSVGVSKVWSYVLWQQVKRGPGTVVDFAELGPGWDRLYIFGPYTRLETIHEAVGRPLPHTWATNIESSEGVNLVVFVRDKEIVGWFEQGRGRGDLCDIANRAGYSRDEARFVVELDRWERLVVVHRGPR
jgi:hypothetical protein